ncbi:MAG: cobalamin-dependent protein, partial [Acetobacterium sp.]|nr:cobalamin-dependent protein [Acetobacterium sp.]
MIAKNIFASANLHQSGGNGIKPLGTVLFGTIFDDIHDIGKDLMIDALENRGIAVIDLGVDVKVEKFIEAVKQHQPDIIAVSCVMTNSIPYLQQLGNALEEKNLLENRRFLLGGAVVNHDYVKIPQIDFMTNNFYEGIRYCEVYLEEKNKGAKAE